MHSNKMKKTRKEKEWWRDKQSMSRLFCTHSHFPRKKKKCTHIQLLTSECHASCLKIRSTCCCSWCFWFVLKMQWHGMHWARSVATHSSCNCDLTFVHHHRLHVIAVIHIAGPKVETSKTEKKYRQAEEIKEEGVHRKKKCKQ